MARTEIFMDNFPTLNVNCFAVNHVPFVVGQPQKKCKRPIVKIKYVNSVPFVDQLRAVQLATNVQNLPVGARLNQLWTT